MTRVAAVLAEITGRFRKDERGAAAVEFAMLCAPFILLLMIVLQMGVFYMAQSALNAGVVRTAETLRTNFMVRPAPTLPAAAVLKQSVATKAGGMIQNNASLLVEVRQLTALSAATVAIADGVADYGTARSVLVLRAQADVVVFVPGFRSLAQIRSSAIVRRQEL